MMNADALMFSEPDEGRDAGATVFSAKNASIGYSQTPVLTGITLSLSPGHALALIGPNGSGKTTLMRALLGSAQLISGELSCPLDFLGYVPQNSDIDRERFGTLSGGQRQRVLVARALVAKPRLVLLDEPFNGLDEPNREALLSLISQAKAQGTAFMISTHDYRVATEVCDESLIVAGRQVAYGPTSQVFRPEIINEAFGGIHSV